MFYYHNTMKHIRSISYFLLLLLLLFSSYKFVDSEDILDGGYIKTCSRPVSPQNSVISFLAAPRRYPDNVKSGGYGVDGYQEHDKVYFECKEGFSQTSHSVMYITCGSNGKWFPKIANLGKCVLNTNFHKCTHGLFRCKVSKKCISARKRCDCTSDCSDGSDEIGCTVHRKIIHATTKGSESSGLISSPGYPRTYPSNFSCIYHISTIKDHHVEINFEEFDLPKKIKNRCIDFVRVIGLHSQSVTDISHNVRNTRQHKIISETKCSRDTFKRVYSQFMHITVNVSMGQHSTLARHRGFIMSWHVRSKEYVSEVLAATEVPLDETNDKSSSEESTYTIITPIAISALLPLSLITVLCCHRHLRRQCSRKKPDDETSTIDVPKNNEQTVSLTENNLALFENQQNYQQIDQSDGINKQTNINQTESDEFSRKNNVNSTTPCDCRCCLANSRNSNVSRIDLVDKFNRDSYSSHQSDIPRYVMSYDVPRRHSPVTSQFRHDSNVVNESSRCVTPERIKRSLRMNKPYNSSPHLNHSLPLRGRHSKSTRDILRHSYHSQSTNSCKLCNHQKNMRKLENHNTNKHLIDDHQTHPVNGDFNEYPHPVNEDFNEYPHPVNKDFNKYPHLVEDGYPDNIYNSVAEFHEYTPPVDYEYHNKNTSFYDYAPNTKTSTDMIYDDHFYHLNQMSRDCNLSDSLSYTEPYQTRVMYIEKTYGQEKFVNTIAYNTKKEDEIYDTHSFNNRDRTEGSLICTH